MPYFRGRPWNITGTFIFGYMWLECYCSSINLCERQLYYKKCMWNRCIKGEICLVWKMTGLSKMTGLYIVKNDTPVKFDRSLYFWKKESLRKSLGITLGVVPGILRGALYFGMCWALKKWVVFHIPIFSVGLTATDATFSL